MLTKDKFTLDPESIPKTQIEEGYYYYDNTDCDTDLNQEHSSLFFKSICVENPNDSTIDLVVLHDIGEYHHRYFELYHREKKSFTNVNLHLFDWPGHGLSSGSRGLLFKHKMLAQLFQSFLQKQLQNKNNVYLWGHGIGANLLEYLFLEHFLDQEFDVKGLIFTSPFTSESFDLPLWGKAFGRVQSDQLKKLYILNFLDGKNRLHSNIEKSHYNADAFNILDMPINNLGLLTKLVKQTTLSKYFLDIPSLFLMGSKDQLVNSRKLYNKISRQYANKAKCHLYRRSGHDLVFDAEKEQVLADIFSWINKVKD